MKVFVDTNVLISYLLGPERGSAASSAVRVGIQGVFDMVISREILNEMTRSISDKPFLRSRIPTHELSIFERLLTNTAVILEPIEAEAFEFSRDKADNFVLPQAIAADVDLILTGDQDLLALGAIGHIAIVDPADFLRILAEAQQT